MKISFSGFDFKSFSNKNLIHRSLFDLAMRLFLVVLTVFLVACVNQSSSNVSTVPVKENNSTNQSTTTQGSVSRATTQLIVDAQRQFENNDWRAAIATAERGLRVDRREVQLYLLIAKSYRALGNLDLSKQFAEQGLRYVAEPSSDIALEFNRLLTVSF